ncbi:MAG: helix-turn-helix transcriptional regulator [Solobacterium sp.]|nr:helix-turn-helix transcriptional regulator [Solobacterium sp.]
MNTSKRKMSEDPVLLRILELLKEQNKSQKDLTDYLGMHSNTFNNWKYGNTRSYLKKIDEIADFLNVTPGYLLKGNSIYADIEGFTPIEKRIVDDIRKLSEEQQQILASFIEKLILPNNSLR